MPSYIDLSTGGQWHEDDGPDSGLHIDDMPWQPPPYVPPRPTLLERMKVPMALGALVTCALYAGFLIALAVRPPPFTNRGDHLVVSSSAVEPPAANGVATAPRGRE